MFEQVGNYAAHKSAREATKPGAIFHDDEVGQPGKFVAKRRQKHPFPKNAIQRKFDARNRKR